MKRFAIAVFAATCLTASVRVPAGLAEEVTIAGSAAMAQGLFLPYQESIEERSGLKLSIRQIGGLRGLRGLLRNEVDIAMTAAPLSELTGQLEAAHPSLLKGQSLSALRLGSFRSALVVHPSNPVRSLTAEAAFAILTGQVTNWNNLGGPNWPIEIVMQQPSGSVRKAVERGLSSSGATLAPTSDVQTLSQVVRAVSVLPRSIGLTTVAAVDPSVTKLQSDFVLEQSMYLVTRDDAGSETEKVIAAAVALFGSADATTWAAVDRSN